MGRYVITTRRDVRDTAVSAQAAVSQEPGVTIVSGSDPQMVTVEASEAVAERLKKRLGKTHIVEAEVRRGLG